MLPNVKLHSYVVQLIRKNAAKAEVFEKKLSHQRPISDLKSPLWIIFGRIYEKTNLNLVPFAV